MGEPPPPRPDWALFLDFDGTLVELCEQPGHVTLPNATATLLPRLRDALGGALAIVSGRAVADLDRLLGPLRLPLAGLHGGERRDARGRLHHAEEAAAQLDPVRDAVAGFVDARNGLIGEDKGGALAVHYRGAPERRAEVAAFLERQRAVVGSGFHVQGGKEVYELRPEDRDKGDAVRAFMAETPFTGRVAVFIGDDRTDEDAFAAVNALGGISIRVGAHHEPTAARHGLESVDAALDWLGGLPERIAAAEAADAGASRTESDPESRVDAGADPEPRDS